VAEISIIGGFLGSGKTTLLKRLLEREYVQGNRPFVIMSEFGDYDVDGAVITDERLDLKVIISGCICCTNRDALAETLKNLLSEKPDSRIYIETTGLADPAGVLNVIIPIARQESSVIRKIVVVFDADRKSNNDQDNRLIEKQLMTADVILVNKIDLVSGDSLEDIIKYIAGINPMAKIIKTVSCVFDLKEALEGETACFSSGNVIEVDETKYQSLTINFDSPLPGPELKAWLGNLPPEVLRVKGFVRLAGQNDLFEIQASAKQSVIAPFDTLKWIESYLVIISHPVTPETLLSGLRGYKVIHDHKGGIHDS
jgi:G3E family GTPase